MKREEFSVLWNTVIGDESDSQTDSCQINQKIVASQLNFRNQIQLMLLKRL